jgi:phosphatidylserine decarboxylase
VRRILLNLIPKVALSRVTGLLTRVPLPVGLRNPFLTWFSKRYGVDTTEMEGTFRDYRSFATFFQRPLKPGARPIDAAALVWPCDGKIISAGPIQNGTIEQVKGVDYTITELIGNEALAARLREGSQAGIYLSPRDYHRVHAPFDAEVLATRRIRGTLYPVNGPAVRAVPRLFVRNARTVFECALPDGRAAAVVMVGALNVGDISVECNVPGTVDKGSEIGRFGFGSTVIVLVEAGANRFDEIPAGATVRMGRRCPTTA